MRSGANGNGVLPVPSAAGGAGLVLSTDVPTSSFADLLAELSVLVRRLQVEHERELQDVLLTATHPSHCTPEAAASVLEETTPLPSDNVGDGLLPNGHSHGPIPCSLVLCPAAFSNFQTEGQIPHAAGGGCGAAGGGCDTANREGQSAEQEEHGSPLDSRQVGLAREIDAAVGVGAGAPSAPIAPETTVESPPRQQPQAKLRISFSQKSCSLLTLPEAEGLDPSFKLQRTATMLNESQIKTKKRMMVTTTFKKTCQPPLAGDPSTWIVTGQVLLNVLMGCGLNTFSENDLSSLFLALNLALASWRRQRDLSESSHLVRAFVSVRRRVTARSDKKHIMRFNDFCTAISEPGVRQYISHDARSMYNAVAQTVLYYDILDVVADLTQLTISEIVQPVPRLPLVERLEPCVVAIIVVNGVLLGVQSDSRFEAWPGWPILELLFLFIMVGELLMRFVTYGARKFFCGREMLWNFLDTSIILASLLEVMFEFVWSVNVVRIIRLARLSRLIRAFRNRFVTDLVIMLKGLLGGFRTLTWAMIVLVATIYVVALFLHSTMSKSERIRELFGDENVGFLSTVPDCMFLTFRCFTADCGDQDGRSVIAMLSQEFGLQFQLPYTLASMMLQFGIFNLITSVYIEATYTAAKSMEANPTRQKTVQSAVLFKDMLQRCVELYWELVDDDGVDEDKATRGYLDICVSPKVFEAILRDEFVHKSLIDLDVPVNSFRLFDVVDADANGNLSLMELCKGVMACRGEPKKSDTVACLLAVRNIQETMAQVHETMAQDRAECLRRLDEMRNLVWRLRFDTTSAIAALRVKEKRGSIERGPPSKGDHCPELHGVLKDALREGLLSL